MPAYSEEFPWPSHYGHFKFFEKLMASHSKVATIKSLGDGFYRLTRLNGDHLKVFVCECYAFGVAQYEEAVDKLGNLDAVIINSAWCGYTYSAKRHCREQRVGLFKIGDFMAALNREDFWKYLSDTEREHFKKSGWV